MTRTVPTIQGLPPTKLKTQHWGSESQTLFIYVGSESKFKGSSVGQGLPENLKNRLKAKIEVLEDKPKAGEVITLSATQKGEPHFVAGVLPSELHAFGLLGFAKSLVKPALSAKTSQLAFWIDDAKAESLMADCLGSAVAARIFEMPVFGQRIEKSKAFALKSVQIFGGKSAEKEFTFGFHKGNGSNIVRYLGTLPPNVLDSAEYGRRIKKICQDLGFEFKFYSKAELKKMGAGSFTAVDQGDPDSHGGIYELTYSPRGAKNKAAIALVGKGLCFDTGGYDIKTGGYMLTMKGDMQGSAVALATMVTASQMKLPLKLKAYLGVTMNHLSPKAYTADEVVVAMNGVSIEVVNTDAEGRMVLADVLCLADKGKPAMIVDFATLTGSAVRSLGTRYSAGFTNMDKLHAAITSSGKESGERVWTFPLDSDFGKALESPVADTLQCVKAGGPDHILAAYFLKKFVGEKTPWVHIDLAAAENDGGLGHTDTLFTGFGVRWAIQFLRRQFKV